MNKFNISKKSFNELTHILQPYNAAIFGSRARGDSRINSDIDIVIFDEISHIEYIKILAKIEDSDIIYKVDLLLFFELNDLLKSEILKYSIPIN